MGIQAFSVSLGRSIDLKKASKGIDYLSSPRNFGMFRACDAEFDGTTLRVFEDGNVRIYVYTEMEAYAEAMFKATESLAYIRRLITDLRHALKVNIDSDSCLASIKPLSEKLDMYEFLLMDIDSVRKTYKGDMSATFFRILHHHTIEEYLGANTAVKMLYNVGEEIGKTFAGLYGTSSLDASLKELQKYLDAEKLGRLKVIRTGEKEVVLQIEEGATSAGMPDVNKPLCHFERGILAGAVSGFLGKGTTCEETRCWGLGDSFCEFLVKVTG